MFFASRRRWLARWGSGVATMLMFAGSQAVDSPVPSVGGGVEPSVAGALPTWPESVCPPPEPPLPVVPAGVSLPDAPPLPLA